MKEKDKSAVYERNRDLLKSDTLGFLNTTGTEPHFHHQIELLVVKKGELSVTINDVHKTVTRGAICISDSYDPHTYKVLTEGTVGHVFIVPKKIIPDYCTKTKNFALKENFLFDEKVFNTIERLTDLFIENNTQENDIFKRGVVSSIMGLLLNVLSYEKRDYSDRFYVMRDILQYIHDNYANELTLESLSKQFGYSPNHFSTLFNTFTGKGLKDYINSVRAEYSKQAIESGTPILDAAFGAGFDSSRTFYRAFSKHYGVPPTHFISTKK